MKKHDKLVFILRAQPFHSAHLEVIRQASKMCKELFLVVGSANQPRTYKNPFSASERMEMIKGAITDLPNVCIAGAINDNMYNNTAWASTVQNLIRSFSTPEDVVGIVGHNKDESSFYLTLFPKWETVYVDEVEPLSATDIRELYFKRKNNINLIKGVVPESTFKFLESFNRTSDFYDLIKEREFLVNHHKQFVNLKFPPVFVTVDCVVAWNEKILMIRRKDIPGKGLLAVPGGYLDNTDVSIQAAALRELQEETNIEVSRDVLFESISNTKVFDAPRRCARGRIITHAFLFELSDLDVEPICNAGDDAAEAFWIDIDDIKREECFEDHFDIINILLGRQRAEIVY